MNLIKIDLDRKIAPINPGLYGSGLEHLGRGVYGGIYEPSSLLADSDGFRQDVLDAVKALSPYSLRWPGGNFVSGYHWQDGVGQQRTPVRDLAWGAVETNRFGTHEYIQYCRKIGAQPFINTNMGTGSPEEAAQWVEYCNGLAGTRFSDERVRNGSPEPFGVKYWGIGNEMNGSWQIGQLSAMDYAKKAKEAAKLMRWMDPTIKLIVAGECTDDPSCVDWDRTLLDLTAPYVDYISVHMYAGNPNNCFSEYMATGERVERKLRTVNGIIDSAMHKTGKKNRIKICFDEWNVFYREDSSPNNGNTIEEKYNLEDALVCATFLNTFLRNADTVDLANQFMLVNVVAPVVTSEEDLFRQTIFYPFMLYSKFGRGESLDCLVECDTYDTALYQEVKLLDVSASYQPETGELNVFVVNRHESEALKAEIRLPEATIAGGKAFEMYHDDIKAENGFLQKDNVALLEKDFFAQGRGFVYEFPPHSLSVLRMKAER